MSDGQHGLIGPVGDEVLLTPSKEAVSLTFRVRSDIEAEGGVETGPDGAPRFVGKVRVSKDSSFEFPEGTRDADKLAAFLQKMLPIGALLERTSLVDRPQADKPSAIAAPAVAAVRVSEPAREARATFNIFGMHCASCAGLIE